MGSGSPVDTSTPFKTLYIRNVLDVPVNTQVQLNGLASSYGLLRSRPCAMTMTGRGVRGRPTPFSPASVISWRVGDQTS